MSELLKALLDERANQWERNGAPLEAQLRERALTEDEQRQFDAAVSAFDEISVRIDAAKAAEARTAAVSEHRTAVGVITSEANPVYRRGDTGVSYFRDMFDSARGGRDGEAARERLAQSQERAATTAAGEGGTFAPPAWLSSEFAAIARAGRVIADQVPNREPLPAGVSSVNVPKATANTRPGVAQTQNTTITEEAFTSTSVSSEIAEITGKQTVSIKLLRQSAVPLDLIIAADLAAGYAVSLDGQVIAGSGANGQLRGLITAGTTVTYTTTVPAVVSTTAANSFYGKLLAAKSKVATDRILPADKIYMTPARWDWVLNAFDTQGRPLVPSAGPQFNGVAVTGEPVAEGLAGTIFGLPVYVDPNIPQNLGAATNQDVVFVVRAADQWLWESPLESASFDATLADQNSVLFRVLGFAAFIPDRYRASVQVISGTGLVAPTF